jgi:hypothetical protein
VKINSVKRIAIICTTFVLSFVLLWAGADRVTRPVIIHAQGLGAVLPFGYVPATNQFPPTSTTGAAGVVTNPSSNFVVQVSGGPIWCNGVQEVIGQSQMTLQANNTYLIVFNCPQDALYAKQAVTGPGSSGTSAINQPGTPNSYLYAAPGVEIALNTVVCNATACGNGGNGSLTDNRTAAFFPNGGTPISEVTFANLPAVPDGNVIICSSCTQPTTGSVTCTSGAAVVLATRVGGAWRCY